MKYIFLFLLLSSRITAFAQQEPPTPANTAVAEKPAKDSAKFSEKMPEFPGGEQALHEYLQNNIKYPEKARDNDIEGDVILQFVVNTDGSISNIKTLQYISGGCTEEAIRVIKTMPKWKPGILNGTPVPVYFNLPVKFMLTKRHHKKKKQ